MYGAKLKANVERTRALLAAGAAIRKTATDAKREFTEAELAEIEKITGEINGLNAERTKLMSGQRGLDLLDETEQSLTAIQPRKTTGLGDMAAPNVEGVSGMPNTWASRIIIPRTQRTDGKLIAFKGPFAKQEAFAFGNWFCGAVLGWKQCAAWCEDNGIPIQASLTGSDNAKGGALVPYELMSAIIDLAESYGIFRQYAEQVPMSTDTQGWPRVTGGMTAYFVGDNDDTTESDPTFDNIDLVAREIAAKAIIPAALAEDAIISIGDLVARKIALAFAYKEDLCGFNGDGTSTYGGMTGAMTKLGLSAYTASVYTAITGNTAFSTLDLADFEAMIGQLPAFAGIQPAWFISKPGWAASMMRLADAAGGNTGPMIVNGIPVQQFLGYPVVISNVLFKTLTASISTAAFLFGDLRMAAMFGTRRAITIGSDGGGKFFEKRQICVLGTERFGINVHECGDTTNPGPLLLCKFPGS